MSSYPTLPSQPSLPGSGDGPGDHVADGDLAVLLAAADDRVPAGARPDTGHLVLPLDWWAGLDPEVLEDPDLPPDVLPHVRQCPQCQGRLVALAPQLGDLSALLGSLAGLQLPPAPEIALPTSPAPPVTPPVTPPPAAPAPPPRRAMVTSLSERRSRRLASPVLLRAAAAVAAVAVVGSVGVSVVRSSSHARSAGSSTSGAGVVDTQSEAAGGTAAGPLAAAAGSGSSTVSSLARTGTDYRAGTLSQQVAALLAAPEATTGTADAGTAGGPDAGTIATCVRQVAPRRGDVTVDEGRWNGQPALVIVAPPAAGSAPGSPTAGGVEVWAVTPDCGSSTSPTLLAHQVVPQP